MKVLKKAPFHFITLKVYLTYISTLQKLLNHPTWRNYSSPKSMISFTKDPLQNGQLKLSVDALLAISWAHIIHIIWWHAAHLLCSDIGFAWKQTPHSASLVADEVVTCTGDEAMYCACSVVGVDRIYEIAALVFLIGVVVVDAKEISSSAFLRLRRVTAAGAAAKPCCPCWDSCCRTPARKTCTEK